MLKNKLFFVYLFCITTLFVNAEPLNSRTANDCLRQVRNFINDNNSYYNIQICTIGITGRIKDNNQINVEKEPDSIIIELLYNNEVMMTIYIEKEKTQSKFNNDSVEFDYSKQLGFSTTYTKYYDRFEQIFIEQIFQSLFEAFGLL